jgi:hypothetical protein
MMTKAKLNDLWKQAGVAPQPPKARKLKIYGTTQADRLVLADRAVPLTIIEIEHKKRGDR